MHAMTWEAWRADDDLAAVAELIDDLLAAHPAPQSDDEPGIDALRDVLVAQGLWSVGLPESAGGGGAELRVVAITLARLARRWPALALACAHTHAAGAAFGDNREWRETLIDLAGGAPIAIVEAVGEFRVDVAAVAPMVVLLGVDGAATVPAEVIHDSPFARTGLAGARSHEVRVADPGTGRRAAANPSEGRAVRDVLIAAIAYGVAHGAVEAAAEYVATREQFGAPLITLPTIADAVFVARAELAAVFDRVLAVAAAPSPTAATAAVRTAFAAALPAATAAIQLHGGYGYLREYPVERALRDLLTLRAAAA